MNAEQFERLMEVLERIADALEFANYPEGCEDFPPEKGLDG